MSALALCMHGKARQGMSSACLDARVHAENVQTRTTLRSLPRQTTSLDEFNFDVHQWILTEQHSVRNRAPRTSSNSRGTMHEKFSIYTLHSRNGKWKICALHSVHNGTHSLFLSLSLCISMRSFCVLHVRFRFRSGSSTINNTNLHRIFHFIETMASRGINLDFRLPFLCIVFFLYTPGCGETAGGRWGASSPCHVVVKSGKIK